MSIIQLYLLISESIVLSGARSLLTSKRKSKFILKRSNVAAPIGILPSHYTALL